MDTTISIFTIKQEPELDIISDGGDDTSYVNDYDNGQDDETVSTKYFTSISLLDWFMVNFNFLSV